MTENDINLVKIIVFSWMFFWAFVSARELIFKRYYSIYIVIIFHFFSTGVPLLVDVLIGQPKYDFLYRLENLRLAASDQTTFWIYCFYVAIAPLIWWYTGRPKKARQFLINNHVLFQNFMDLNVNYKFSQTFKFIKLFLIFFCYFLLFLPTILWFFSPNPSLYITYGDAKSIRILSDAEGNHHRLIYFYCYVSLLGAMGLISLQKKKVLSYLNFGFWLTFLTPIFIAFWLHGKRNIIAYGIFVIFISLMAKGCIKGTKILILFVTVIISFGWFSYLYQTSLVRDITQDKIYEISRLDYASDHLIKISIYSELNPDKIRILDYRFQTFYFNVVQYIPRLLWAGKPSIYTYGPLLSAATFQIPVEDITGGIKGCWLAEALSNFGWTGILFGPLMMSLFCRTGDNTNNKFITIFTSLIALRLTVGYLSLVNTSLLIIWSIFVIRDRHIKKRKIRSLHSTAI